MPSGFPLFDAFGQFGNWLGNATIDAADAGFDLFTGQWGQPGILRSLMNINQGMSQNLQGQIEDPNLPKVATDTGALADLQAKGGNNVQFAGTRFDAGQAPTPLPSQPGAGISPIATALTPQQLAVQSEAQKMTTARDALLKQINDQANPYAESNPIFQRLMNATTDDAWAAGNGGDRAIASDYAARGMAGSGQAAAAQGAYAGNYRASIDNAQNQFANQWYQQGVGWNDNRNALLAQLGNSNLGLDALNQLSNSVNQQGQFYANLAQNKDLTMADLTQRNNQFFADLGLRTEQGNRAADAQAGAGLLQAGVMSLPYLIPGLQAAAPFISGAAGNAVNWLTSSHGDLPTSYFSNTTPQRASSAGKAGPIYPSVPVAGTVPNYYDAAAQRGGIQNQAAFGIGGLTHPTPSYPAPSLGYSPIPGMGSAQQLPGFRSVQLRR